MRLLNFRKSICRVAMIMAFGIGTSSSVSAQSYIADSNRRISAFHFAASEQLVAFPVPVGPGTVGLVVIDRKTGQKRLIQEDKAFFLYPRFSQDGKRLIVNIDQAHTNKRKLIVCTVDNWHCRTWLDTTATIRSPLELDRDTILFSSSPVEKGSEGKPLHNKHDFYLLNYGAQPKRLSDFRLQELSSINVAGSRLVFQARKSPAEKNSIFVEVRPVAGPGSEIYALDFDPSRHEIRVPAEPLRPLVLIEGYSTRPSTSLNGKLAFLNQRTKDGRTHFNLAVAASNGQVKHYIDASGWAFSPPVFVGEEVVANEIFDRHYEIKSFDASSGKSTIVATLEYSEQALKELERISLKFEQ